MEKIEEFKKIWIDQIPRAEAFADEKLKLEILENLNKSNAQTLRFFEIIFQTEDWFEEIQESLVSQQRQDYFSDSEIHALKIRLIRIFFSNLSSLFPDSFPFDHYSLSLSRFFERFFQAYSEFKIKENQYFILEKK